MELLVAMSKPCLATLDMVDPINRKEKRTVMALPPTYYDFVLKLRPTLVEMGEQDAADLQNGLNPLQVVHSVDDYESRFSQYIKRLNAEILGYGADHSGVSIYEMAPLLSTAPPKVKAVIASLYGTVDNEYHCAVNFALAGKKTFHFSDNLAEHLANTEINVKAALIQLPFPTCLFTFTSRAVINAMHNIRGDAGRWAMNVAGLAFYRIILNALLYLSSDKAELTAKKGPRKEIEGSAKGIASLSKRKRLLQTTGWYTALDYEEVGASVGPIVIQKVEVTGGEGASAGGKPLVRFMVRGHWRQQLHGPEIQHRKLVWIQPYYKGPDLAATINKPYLVK